MERLGVSGVQFILQILLARLLTPDHYGVLAIMVIFTNLANVFIQNGFNTALIQNKDVTEEDYSSVFWVSFTIAVILYGIIYFTAPYIGMFYNMPDLVLPLRVLAIVLLPGALNSIQYAKVSREMDFKKAFYSNVGGIVFSGLVGIIIAKLGGGIWALVVQTLLNVLIAAIVMSFTTKLRLRLVCNIRRVKVLFSFGWKLLVSSLLETLYTDLSGLIIGKKYSAADLGYYNRGMQFPQFISNTLSSAISGVMLPVMSMEQDDKSRVKAVLRNSISLSSYVIFPLMAGLAAAAAPLVRVLLTDKWLPCVPYMQVFCFSFAFYPIHICNLQAINAMGRSDIYLKLEIIKKVYSIIVLYIAVVCFQSPFAIAATGFITTWIGWIVNSYPNRKMLDYTYREQISDFLPSAILALVMGATVLQIGRLGLHPLIVLIVQVVAGVIIYIVLSVVFKPNPFKLLVTQIKNMMGKDI